MSKFSCSDNSVRNFVPISAVRWRLGPTSDKRDVEELVYEIANREVTGFGNDESLTLLQGNRETIAVWLLVATASDCYEAYTCQKDVNTSWRLALLANSVVIMGSVVDPK